MCEKAINYLFVCTNVRHTQSFFRGFLIIYVCIIHWMSRSIFIIFKENLFSCPCFLFSFAQFYPPRREISNNKES
jgi:hypothetical protein